jgi:hypothetical protein
MYTKILLMAYLKFAFKWMGFFFGGGCSARGVRYFARYPNR